MKPGSAFRALLTVIGLAGAFIFENVRMLLNDVILEMISIQGLVGAQAATVHLLRKAPALEQLVAVALETISFIGCHPGGLK